MLPERTDVLVVGGGIIGLTIARELVRAGRRDVVILEKEPDLGKHASGRNSGVLHAGIYYAPDSAKARTCLSGNKLMRAFCAEKGLPVLEAGKVIVARTEEELPTLEELHRRASANGARVRFVDEKELAELEPMARTVGKALHSLDTAAVDPKAVLRALRAELEGQGVRIVTGCRFLGRAGPDRARTSAGDIRYARLVNAAGAHCDVVARAFGVAEHYRLIPFKGIYRKLRAGASFPVNGNIYPVPDIRNPFLGVHFSRSVHGDVYLGPTAIPALGRENYGLLARRRPGGLLDRARGRRPLPHEREVPERRAHRAAQVPAGVLPPGRGAAREAVRPGAVRPRRQGRHPPAARGLADEGARDGLPRRGAGRDGPRPEPDLARVHLVDGPRADDRPGAPLVIILGGLLAVWGALVLGLAGPLHTNWKKMLGDMRRSGVRNTLPLTDFFASAEGLRRMRIGGGAALALGLGLVVAGLLRGSAL